MTNTNKTNLFEVAVRNKFRFPFRGLISAEDLWTLSVTNLDSIFKTLNSELKQVQEESLLNTKTKADKELDMKIEIVKHIVAIKIEEQNKKLQDKENAEKKQKIMELIEKKNDESLENKSAEELKALLNEM